MCNIVFMYERYDCATVKHKAVSKRNIGAECKMVLMFNL